MKSNQDCKVAFVVDHLRGGGIASITINLANQYVSNGFTVAIIVLNNNNCLMNTENINIYDLQIPPEQLKYKFWNKKNELLSKEYGSKLKEAINVIKPESLILGMNKAYWFAPYLKQEDINFYMWIHADIADFEPKFKAKWNHRRLEKRRINRIKKYFPKLFSECRIITVNEDLKDKYQPYAVNSKFDVIHNGVKLPTCSLYQNDKVWDVIFLGRLVPSKQVLHAVKAFASTNLDKMVIVGDGEHKQKLLEYINNNNLNQRIDYLGWKNDSSKYISKSKCLVSSSYSEGSGLGIAEAFSIGVPVVAYNCSSGVAYQFSDDNVRRGLVPAQDIDALSRSMQSIVNDPYKISSKVKDKISINHTYQQFINVLN